MPLIFAIPLAIIPALFVAVFIMALVPPSIFSGIVMGAAVACVFAGSLVVLVNG